MYISTFFRRVYNMLSFDITNVKWLVFFFKLLQKAVEYCSGHLNIGLSGINIDNMISPCRHIDAIVMHCTHIKGPLMICLKVVEIFDSILSSFNFIVVNLSKPYLWWLVSILRILKINSYVSHWDSSWFPQTVYDAWARLRMTKTNYSLGIFFLRFLT